MSKIGHNGGPRLLNEYRERLHTGGGGWVRIERRMRDHRLVGFGQPVAPMHPDKGALSKAEAWQDLIMECRYEAGKVKNGGREMAIEPGQLVGAVSWLADRWNWTPKTVRTFLDKLVEEGMIELVTQASLVAKGKQEGEQDGKQKGKQAALVSVCNYAEYQNVHQQQGQAKGQAQGQAEGQQYKDNTSKQDTNYIPPTPLEGGDVVRLQQINDELQKQLAAKEAEAAELRAAIEAGRAKKKNRATHTDEERKQVAEAFEAYNKAAGMFGLSVCETFTDSRAARLLKRLEAIGGLENFKRALWALRLDRDQFVRFLRGKVPPRQGESPFLLDIDRLMQTEGNLGDVLARLLDIGAKAGSSQEPQKVPWDAWSREQWREQITAHANGIWPRDKIGFWPGHPKCAAPPDLIAEMQHNGELGKYDSNGICKDKH